MLDINSIRQNTDKIKKACNNKNVDEKLVDRLLEVDKRYRENIRILEKDRHDLNDITEKFKKEKDDK
ncbi:MAG TPA: serine--tRNA ligase, partial [Candidatus Bathyarchaeia archaeon]|nr:serine--tRNA ligase [Candidatus Bathyarchaeia archaeon]